MDKEITGESGKDNKKVLKPEDIGLLFPHKVITSSEDYVQKAPRDGIVFEQFYCPSDLVRDSGCTVWKFSNVALRPNEAAYLDLPPFCIEIDYFGGAKDLRMLFDLLKVVGKPRNEKSILGFKLFFDKVMIGVLGCDYPSGYDKDADKFKPTKQLTIFKKAILGSQNPTLILSGHGGSDYTLQESEQKTIGNQNGPERISLSAYLQHVDLTKYSTIIDLSCTVNPRFCLETLPGLLPDNCPSFFGSLEEIDGGLGIKSCDTYLIKNHKTTVFRK